MPPNKGNINGRRKILRLYNQVCHLIEYTLAYYA